MNKELTEQEYDVEQLFDNNSDCYADTGRFENDGSYTEGEVISAMTKSKFLECYKAAQSKQKESSERVYTEAEMKNLYDYMDERAVNFMDSKSPQIFPFKDYINSLNKQDNENI